MNFKKKFLFFLKKKLIILIYFLNKLNKIKNKHYGESCYIFGDGNSIKYIDLNRLPKKPAFFLNMMVFHHQSALFPYGYSVIIEPWWFWPYKFMKKDSSSRSFYFWKNKINRIHKSYAKDKMNLVFVEFSNFLFTIHRRFFHLFRSLKDENFLFQKKVIESGEDPFAGSVFCAMTLAVYMGFSEITLIGCDYTHGNHARSGHWYEKGKGEEIYLEKYHDLFFEEIQKYVKLRTLTIESCDTLIPSLTYEEYTGDKPNFKENIELTELKVLDILSSWKDYKIF